MGLIAVFFASGPPGGQAGQTRTEQARQSRNKKMSTVPETWDVEADVVVVGFGAAGFAASVAAHDLGAEVVILEKAPEGEHGGNTRVAGQGYLNTSTPTRPPPI